MTLRLKPNPAVPPSITTATDSPIFADKKQFAEMCGCTTRTVDNWRSQGLLPYIRLGGTILFDVQQCLEVIRTRFVHQEAGSPWAGRGSRPGERRRKGKKYPAADPEDPQNPANQIIAIFRENPTISIKDAAVKAEVHPTTAWRAKKQMAADGEISWVDARIRIGPDGLRPGERRRKNRADRKKRQAAAPEDPQLL